MLYSAFSAATNSLGAAHNNSWGIQMHRIDGPGATVDGKFTEGNPAAGVPATVVTAAWMADVQEELLSVLSAGGVAPIKGVQDQLLRAIRTMSTGVIGTALNLKMSVASASASATLTADQVVVGSSLAGQVYRLSSLSKTINLATVGAGGMDTGSAPASGFVGLYAIYNPVSGASALLAVNATSSLLPNVYGGANMPAGYTASALVSVWPTNASGQFAVGIQVDREIGIATNNVLTTSTVQASLTAFSVAAAIPRNALTFRGEYTCSSTVAGAGVSGVISGSPLEIGRIAIGMTSPTASGAGTTSFPLIAVLNAQTIYYRAAVSSGVLSLLVSITGYTF